MEEEEPFRPILQSFTFSFHTPSPDSARVSGREEGHSR